MTTLAFKDGVLAADTLITMGDHRDGYAVKIARRGRVLAGASGSTARCTEFLDWFRKGMVGMPPAMKHIGSETNATAHIFADGRILTWDASGWTSVTADHYAAGSGFEYAMGAMSAGASAEQAVRIAIRHDSKSGGDVTVLRATPPRRWPSRLNKTLQRVDGWI